MSRLSSLAMAAATACTLVAAPVAAGSPVVVELFTSQGCSSCPAADALLHELADRDDVIALALHVDYWDYIGWKDAFADPANARRQRAYAVEAGRRSVYTPQMIINGTTDIVGAKPMKLAEAIGAHAERPSPVRLDIARSGNRVDIRATADGGGPYVVHLLRYDPEREVDILRGENAGRRISYANVTHSWDIVAEWDGGSRLDLDAPAPGDHPVVVLIQEGRVGPIRAAARLR